MVRGCGFVCAGAAESKDAESATADANGAHYTENTEKNGGHGDIVLDAKSG